MNSDHKEIWLEPEPPLDDDEVGRTWCQDNVYDPYDYDNNKPTRYIRADLYQELEAKLDAVRGLQRYMPLAKSGHQNLIETEKVCWRRSPDGIEVVRADELDAALEGGE